MPYDHKKRILDAVKREERKKEVRSPKERPFKRHYARRRIRFDTYLPHEGEDHVVNRTHALPTPARY